MATAHISSPKTGEAVPRAPRAFTVRGTLRDVPRGNHVWLAVQVGNLLFPKEPEIPVSDEEWVQQIVEGGIPPDGEFSLILVRVGRRGQLKIKRWLSRGREGKGFPGLPTIPGSARLDVVDQLTLK